MTKKKKISTFKFLGNLINPHFSCATEILKPDRGTVHLIRRTYFLLRIPTCAYREGWEGRWERERQTHFPSLRLPAQRQEYILLMADRPSSPC